MSTSKPVPAERFIVLLRHGIAEDAAPDQKDEERALTKKGRAEMKDIARGLKRVVKNVDAIYSSPLLRAMQTAKRIAKVYDLDVTMTDALRPGASPKELLKGRVILIGHEPDLTETMRAITGIKTGRVQLDKGGCYGIRDTTLEWVLTPRVLRKL
jgi:phosphohistidine phosphatase